jgi:hypothetical protein
VNDLVPIVSPPSPDGKSKRPYPFSALPHALRKDPRLKRNHLAVVLAAALLEYARDRPSCYPTNATLAEDLGCGESTVRAALAVLKATGWIRVDVGPRQPNGRRIWLTWREGSYTPSPQVSDTRLPAGTDRRAVGIQCRAVGTEEERIEEGIKEGNVTAPLAQSTPESNTPEPPILPDAQASILRDAKAAIPPSDQGADSTLVAQPPMPQDDIAASPPVRPAAQPPTPINAQAPTAPVPPLLEELQTIGPDTTPATVRRLASRLCAILHDPGSLGFYIATLGKVVAGTLSVPCLLAAAKAGIGSVGRAQRPGALFCFTLNNYVQPPLPSQVRYYQAPSTAATASNLTPAPVRMAAPVDEPSMTPEEELQAMRGFAANPRHPLHDWAVKQLAEASGQ